MDMKIYKKKQDDLEDEAVSIALEDIVVGEEYEGVVNNVVTYGAFVDIGTEVLKIYVHTLLLYCACVWDRRARCAISCIIICRPRIIWITSGTAVNVVVLHTYITYGVLLYCTTEKSSGRIDQHSSSSSLEVGCRV